MIWFFNKRAVILQGIIWLFRAYTIGHHLHDRWQNWINSQQMELYKVLSVHWYWMEMMNFSSWHDHIPAMVFPLLTFLWSVITAHSSFPGLPVTNDMALGTQWEWLIQTEARSHTKEKSHICISVYHICSVFVFKTIIYSNIPWGDLVYL